MEQTRLTKAEWTQAEVPVSEGERKVLAMLQRGYHDPDVCSNPHESLLTQLSLTQSEAMDDELFRRHFETAVRKLDEWLVSVARLPKQPLPSATKRAKLCKADLIRLSHASKASVTSFETLLLDQAKATANATANVHAEWYALRAMRRATVPHVNRHVATCVDRVLDAVRARLSPEGWIEQAWSVFEHNPRAWACADLRLHDHQKQLIEAIRRPGPKLVLYSAPTGEGKTLAPIALTEGKRVIFVCAARHVGLALAKAAISVQKKVAFAFGCASPAHVRLHYFAAKECTRDRRTGRIVRVDNRVGSEVQLMICDLASFPSAMVYMLSFFAPEDLVLYWDEPTISLDCETHPFHATIHRNWRLNRVPVVVLSCATLPDADALVETIPSFLRRFPGAEVVPVCSHRSRRSVPLVDDRGRVVAPHHAAATMDELRAVAEHCEHRPALWRYVDWRDVSAAVRAVLAWLPAALAPAAAFADPDAVDGPTAKQYYWAVLRAVADAGDPAAFAALKREAAPRTMFPVNRSAHGRPEYTWAPGTSGGYLTTSDAYTLTDGPTLFVTEDLATVSAFLAQQAQLPGSIEAELHGALAHNERVATQLGAMERELDRLAAAVEERVKNEVSDSGRAMGRSRGNKDPKKLGKDVPDEVQDKGRMARLVEAMQTVRATLRKASLPDAWVPNTQPHLAKWAPEPRPLSRESRPFCGQVDDRSVADIMALPHVSSEWKLLLLMGVGVFSAAAEHVAYTELMKRLAEQQRLYLILAPSDYIYGTNYQFCHGFLGRSMVLTPEKLVQFMGRVGRQPLHQTYTVRFRDAAQIERLFRPDADSRETRLMNCLFTDRAVEYHADTDQYWARHRGEREREEEEEEGEEDEWEEAFLQSLARAPVHDDDDAEDDSDANEDVERVVERERAEREDELPPLDDWDDEDA